MEKLTFYKNGEVPTHIRELCLKNVKNIYASYYTIQVKNALVFVVDENIEKTKYSDILKNYKQWFENEKTVRKICKELPDIEIEINDFEYERNNTCGSFNDTIKKECDWYDIEFDISVTENHSYESDINQINASNCKIEVSELVVKLEDGEIDLCKNQVKKLKKAITKNIRL